MSEGIYPFLKDPYLDSMRLVGDPLFDPVVKDLLQQDRSILYKTLQTVTDNASLPTIKHTAISSLAERSVCSPDLSHASSITEGQSVFQEYASEIMLLLGAVSLPYCYAAAKGARVLYLSEKMGRHTHQRLLDTSSFVWDVLKKGAFEPQGSGYAAIFKTRIIHAMVRYHVRRHPDWQHREEIPINQEDMSGTNLAFSYMILMGLGRLGHSPTTAQKEGFLYLWNLISGSLGLRTELQPCDMKQAYWLEKAIRKRQFRASEEGKTLLSSLLDYYRKTIPDPIFRPFIKTQMAFLLGDEVAGLLGIAPSKVQSDAVKTLMAPIQWSNRLRRHSSTLEEALKKRNHLMRLSN